MFTRADKFLIVTLIILSAISYPVIRYLTDRVLLLEIEVMGDTYSVVTMEGERELVIPGRLGDSVIGIDVSGARFLSTPGPDRGCIDRGYISEPGETVECVPNGVSIRIIGGDKTGPDFITR